MHSCAAAAAGRTPAIWNLDLRFAYTVGEGVREKALRPTVTLDLYHVASAQKAVQFDQVHFAGVDAMGNQIFENPNFLKPTKFQPPMAARLGLAVAF
jgi:hypothetical protein